jgi:tetratricopeptide (TPR) repeat protein
LFVLVVVLVPISISRSADNDNENDNEPGAGNPLFVVRRSLLIAHSRLLLVHRFDCVAMSPVYTQRHLPAISPWLLVLTPFVALVLYWPVVNHPLFGEAARLISPNTQVTVAHPARSLWIGPTPVPDAAHGIYRPVWTWLLRRQWAMWANSPSSYHALSLLLFIGAGVLLLLVTSRLLEDPRARAASVLVFVLHPMASQSVQNLADQGLLWSLAACLAAVYVHLRYQEGRLGPRKAFWLLALLTGVAAGCHELGLVLPVWLLALGFWRRPPDAEAVKAGRGRGSGDTSQPRFAAPRPGQALWLKQVALPVMLPVGLYLALRLVALHGLWAALAAPEEAGGPLAAKAPSFLALYLGRLVWPAESTVFFTLESGGSLPSPAVGWAAAVLALAGLTAAARAWPRVALGLVWTLAPLAGLSHVVPLSRVGSEGPLLFPLVGVALLVGVGAEALLAAPGAAGRRKPGPAARRQALTVLLVAVGALLAWRTWTRTAQWSDPARFWEAEVARHPNRPDPLLAWMREALRLEQWDQALELSQRVQRTASGAQYDEVIELEAGYYAGRHEIDKLRAVLDRDLQSTRTMTPGHLTRLGRLALNERQGDMAESLMRKELDAHPHLYEANFELAGLERIRKQYGEALRLCSSAIQAADDARRPDALARYGMILADAGHREEAIRQLEIAVAANRAMYQPYTYLVRLYWGRKDYARAEDAINRCSLNAPVTSFIDLAKMRTAMLLEQKQVQPMLDWQINLVNRYPTDAALLLYIARTQLEWKRFDAARGIYQRLSGLPGPLQAEVWNGMALVAWFGDQTRDQAMRYWQRALQLDPNHAEARRWLDRAQNDSGRMPALEPTPVVTPTFDELTTTGATLVPSS